MVMWTFKCGLTNLVLGAGNWKFENMPIDCFLLWIQITVTLRGKSDLVKPSSGQWYKLLCTRVVDCLSTAIYGCKDSTMLNLGFSLEYSPSQPWVIRQFCIILVPGRGMVASATKGVVGYICKDRWSEDHTTRHQPWMMSMTLNPDDLIVVYILNKIRAF